MNRSKDLRKLFRESLVNSRKCSSMPPMYNNRGYTPYRNIQFNSNTKIYFYEWSDLTKNPRTFFNLYSFDSFLKTCGIDLQFYQREIINNLGVVYITCYTGTHDLNIRGTYKGLLDSMCQRDAKLLLSKIQRPEIVFETNNKMVENDGTFFG